MTEQEAFSKLQKHVLAKGVPEHLVDGLCRYYLFGNRPGSFISAVLSNDLKATIAFGDPVSLAALKQFVVFLNNNLPQCCWGNTDNYLDWLDGCHQSYSLEQLLAYAHVSE